MEHVIYICGLWGGEVSWCQEAPHLIIPSWAASNHPEEILQKWGDSCATMPHTATRWSLIFQITEKYSIVLCHDAAPIQKSISAPVSPPPHLIIETLKMKSDYTSLEAFGSVLWIWKLKTQPSTLLWFYAFNSRARNSKLKMSMIVKRWYWLWWWWFEILNMCHL